MISIGYYKVLSGEANIGRASAGYYKRIDTIATAKFRRDYRVLIIAQGGAQQSRKRL
jgi:hypothetical protein